MHSHLSPSPSPIYNPTISSSLILIIIILHHTHHTTTTITILSTIDLSGNCLFLFLFYVIILPSLPPHALVGFLYFWFFPLPPKSFLQLRVYIVHVIIQSGVVSGQWSGETVWSVCLPAWATRTFSNHLPPLPLPLHAPFSTYLQSMQSNQVLRFCFYRFSLFFSLSINPIGSGRTIYLLSDQASSKFSMSICLPPFMKMK